MSEAQEDLPVVTSSLTPRFVITGFGPFGALRDNPTAVIVRNLQSFLERTKETAHLASLIDDCILLETSVQDVNRVCDRLQMDFFKGGDNDEPPPRSRILLHLGVDEKSHLFKLESCAYNESTFRIPDQQGYQPRNISIFEEQEYKSCLRTSLNVDELAKTMTKRFPQVTTQVSTDPGRYVCNYIYCSSLVRFGKVDSNACSLFLHVPQFAIVREEQQLEYVAALLNALAYGQEENPVQSSPK
jgi:pyroglutamyl-peptidase